MRAPIILVIACAAALASAHSPKENPWMRVPGGQLIHKDCIYSVKSGHHIKDIKPCPYRAQVTMPEDQVYAMDVHWCPTTEIMSSFQASFTAPTLPATDDGQVLYYWPGFKSTQPTMGFPVLQPVLQYGTDCCGGGDYWCVRSWFVWGNEGVAYQSAETPVSPGDLVTSSMSINAESVWTITATNTRTNQNTTLMINKADAGATDYHCAMLVNEVIMDLGECSDLPASNTITFSNVKVNNKAIAWTDRVTDSSCGQKLVDKSTTVTMNWVSSSKEPAVNIVTADG